MKLCFIFAFREGQGTDRPVLWEALAILRRRGFEVDVAYTVETLAPVAAPLPAYDLYLLKSRSAFWLTVAAILHEQGARILNPYPGCAATLNKAVMTYRLRAGGVPTPPSWLAGDPALLRELAERGPLIRKPCAAPATSTGSRRRSSEPWSRATPREGATFSRSTLSATSFTACVAASCRDGRRRR